jgi:hypothetical protein
MKLAVCFLMFSATCLQADIQTVTAAADPGGLYAYSLPLASFDTSLGTLDSVDLTVAATFRESLHYGNLNSDASFPFPGSIAYTTTGTSSFFGTQTADSAVNLYIQGQSCLAPACTFLATMNFGGETTFTDSADLAQFETGNPMSLGVSANVVVTNVSPGVACCVSINNGDLSLDVAAAYTYTPLDPAPELSATLFLLVMAVTSLVAQRHHRIDPCRAHGRKQTRQNGSAQEHEGRRGES